MRWLPSNSPTCSATSARQRVERLFHGLWHNTDSATYALAQDVLGGRHTRLEEGVMDPSGEGPMVPPPEPGKSGGITPEAAAGANVP